MRMRRWVGAGVLSAAVFLAGCSGGGGGGGKKSEVTVQLDGADSESESQTSGVDAAGNTFVVIAGADWSIEIRFPGDSTGDFGSSGTDGATVIYTDSNGDTFVADDATAGSSYEIHVTSHDENGIEGSFEATVVGPGAASHTLSATFALVLNDGSASDPYGGTYIGIFEMRGQVQTGTDQNTGEPIWGPMQTASLRVTLHFDLLALADEGAVYIIDEATISDAFFGCQLGCTPEQGSVATLPADPGTPTPNGVSSAGMGVTFTVNGELVITSNAEGELYTSTDGRIISKALSVEDPSWLSDYEEHVFGVVFYSLNPDTRTSDWSLTRSAL